MMFMFKHDNLYNLSVPEGNKGRSLQAHYDCVHKFGYRKSFVTPDTADTLTDAKHSLGIILHHLWRQGINFSVLDIGAFIGNFSIKMGNSIRTFGKENKVYAFDPTEAGALIPFNIDINGLSDIVFYQNLAVGEWDGYYDFQVTRGQSDASFAFGKEKHTLHFITLMTHLAKTAYKKAYLNKLIHYFRPKETYTLLAPGVSIVNWLERNKIGHSLFVKLDVEGLEPTIIKQLLTLKNERHLILVFEFTPNNYSSHSEAISFLSDLAVNFHIFDIWYSPMPNRCDLVTSKKMPMFVKEIATKRIFGYTDILAVPKSIPDMETLAIRLKGLKRGPNEYIVC